MLLIVDCLLWLSLLVNQPSTEPHSSVILAPSDDSAGEAGLLAAPCEEEREALVRENAVDPLDEEQTFPTEEELRDAERFHHKMRKKRVPKGAGRRPATTSALPISCSRAIACPD